jgi:hypothetical protein
VLRFTHLPVEKGWRVTFLVSCSLAGLFWWGSVVRSGSASVWSGGESYWEGRFLRELFRLVALRWTGLRNDNPHSGALVLLCLARERTKFCLCDSVVLIRVSAGFAMLTKWFSFTRLETRTKESNIYASIWVLNPDAQ